jgi:hypothetical protein
MITNGRAEDVREAVIKTITDPDFGVLDLIETQADPRIDGRTPATYRTLLGKCPPPNDCMLIISSEEELEQISAAMRESFHRVLADVDAMKTRMAEKNLDLAREWAEAGGLELELDTPKLAGLLKLDGVDVAGQRLTLYFIEDADIFADHVLEARLDENGEITETCLAG